LEKKKKGGTDGLAYLYCRWGTKVGGASRKEEEEEKGD
jgi:hypothetical protein